MYYWYRRFVLSVVLCMPGIVAAQANAAPPAKPADIGFCRPYTWLSGGWVAAPRMPLAGDINGDGYADFLDASPADKIIDVSINGKGLKPLRGYRLVNGLPETIAAYTFAHAGGKALDIAVLGEQGAVSLVKSQGAGAYDAPVTVAHVTAGASKSWIFSGPAGKDGAELLIVVSADGKGTLLSTSGTVAGELKLEGGISAASAGSAGKQGVYVAIRHGSKASVYKISGGKSHRITTLDAPAAAEAIAMGDINGDGSADLLCNGKVYLAPAFKASVIVAGWDKLKAPVSAMLADIAGHGRADLIVQHLGSDYYGSFGTDRDVYITYFKSDLDWDCDGLTNEEEAKIGSDPLDRSTSHDGLLDGWKEHGFAGIDLKKMGASPLHKDVFVLNQRIEGINQESVERYMQTNIAPFFARLPYKNLDGTSGFALHWIDQPALSTAQHSGKPWQQIAGEQMPADKIGLCHWMLVNGLGGGGQSNQLADAGSSGMGSWSHEFGHQLGLSHTGKWATWSPTYTSLMNYSYSYQFDGRGDRVHFSNGELAGLILNETHLPGKVPYPIEKLQFLANRPYHFHLKAADANSTYIDWGWSGVFSDRTVRANITYGYGVGAGERMQPSGKQSFNYNGPYELMTDKEAALCEHKGKLYMATASRDPLAVEAPRPHETRLVLQTHVGKNSWSEPVLTASRVTGEPYLVSDNESLYVLYPTDAGVAVRFGSPDALSPERIIPGTAGAAVSAVYWHGKVWLILWRGAVADVAVMPYDPSKSEAGPEVSLKYRSTLPPGPAIDTLKDQLLLGGAAPLGNQNRRWQIRRFTEAGSKFTAAGEAWVGGPNTSWAGSRRPSVIFSSSPDAGPNGKIYFIAAGNANSERDAVGFYIAQTIAYKETNDGWLLWRYYDEWTNTRSGVSAAWFNNDITVATTWASGTAGGDGGVFVGEHGLAISDVDMGDFDDIALMANYGMSRSIGAFAKMPQ